MSNRFTTINHNHNKTKKLVKHNMMMMKLIYPRRNPFSRLFKSIEIQHRYDTNGRTYMIHRNSSRIPVVVGNRHVSTQPESQQQSQSPEQSNPIPYEFHSPKAKDLFERITTTMTKKDVLKLADEVNMILGRPIRKHEFYYSGFGGSIGSSKNKKSGNDLDDSESQPQAPVAPTVVDMKLTGYDAASKIKVIKEIRSIANLGLKEAKDLVESAPKIIQKGLKPEEAELLKKKLEEVGAIIELV
jgi:large subunit ribosomal protein L7/L12